MASWINTLYGPCGACGRALRGGQHQGRGRSGRTHRSPPTRRWEGNFLRFAGGVHRGHPREDRGAIAPHHLRPHGAATGGVPNSRTTKGTMLREAPNSGVSLPYLNSLIKFRMLDCPVIFTRPFLPSDPVLVVHGGAWAIPDLMVEAHLNGVRNAMAAGWDVLQRGGPALDAVEEAVVVMEDDETFDAGRGSFLNREGKVQLDALIMDGATLRAGGVGCVEHIANPVRAARKVLSESPHVYFVAEGAECFAQEHGISLCKNEDLILPREIERLRAFQAKIPTSRAQNAREMGHPGDSGHDGNDLFAPEVHDAAISHDTVGAVALDRDGNIAAATSTGGTLNKAPG